MTKKYDTFVEIILPVPDNFLLIAETLTRIGIASKKEKKLFQSCHILHKKGKYYIVHFKEMFILDGRNTTFNDEDRMRRNTIVSLLEEWELLTLPPESVDKIAEQISLTSIRVIPFKEKAEWELCQKYSMGTPSFPLTPKT